MKQITCYSCDGIFWIDEDCRRIKRFRLKLKKDHIAESWVVEKKVKRGVSCPYCHSHLFDNVLKKQAL